MPGNGNGFGRGGINGGPQGGGSGATAPVDFDLFVGTPGADTFNQTGLTTIGAFLGLAGDDTIFSGSGDDVIIPGTDNDLLGAGSGDDIIALGRDFDPAVDGVLFLTRGQNEIFAYADPDGDTTYWEMHQGSSTAFTESWVRVNADGSRFDADPVAADTQSETTVCLLTPDEVEGGYAPSYSEILASIDARDLGDGALDVLTAEIDPGIDTVHAFDFATPTGAGWSQGDAVFLTAALPGVVAADLRQYAFFSGDTLFLDPDGAGAGAADAVMTFEGGVEPGVTVGFTRIETSVIWTDFDPSAEQQASSEQAAGDYWFFDGPAGSYQLGFTVGGDGTDDWYGSAFSSIFAFAEEEDSQAPILTHRLTTVDAPDAQDRNFVAGWWDTGQLSTAETFIYETPDGDRFQGAPGNLEQNNVVPGSDPLGYAGVSGADGYWVEFDANGHVVNETWVGQEDAADSFDEQTSESLSFAVWDGSDWDQLA